MEAVGGQAESALAKDDQLFHAVGRGNAHTVVFSDLVRGFFNIGVCRFRFLRIDNVDIIICHYLFLVKRDAVGVKNQNNTALAHALIVAENIHQKPACRVEMVGGDGFELVPCKDYIVPIHKQIFRPGGNRPCFRLR